MTYEDFKKILQEEIRAQRRTKPSITIGALIRRLSSTQKRHDLIVVYDDGICVAPDSLCTASGCFQDQGIHDGLTMTAHELLIELRLHVQRGDVESSDPFVRMTNVGDSKCRVSRIYTDDEDGVGRLVLFCCDDD